MTMSWVRGFLNPRNAVFRQHCSRGFNRDWRLCVLRGFAASQDAGLQEFFIRDVVPYSLIWSFVLIIPVNLMVSSVSGIIAMVWPSKREKG